MMILAMLMKEMGFYKKTATRRIPAGRLDDIRDFFYYKLRVTADRRMNFLVDERFFVEDWFGAGAFVFPG